MRTLSRSEKLLHIGAATSLGALLLSGCSEESMEQVRKLVAAEQASTDRSQACPSAEDERTTEQAQQCERFKRTGKIALIGYHIDNVLLQNIAKEAEDKTNRTYSTNVTFTAIPATEALSYLLDKKSPDCISNEYPVSLSAAKVMDDDLEQYDAIVGAASFDDCDASAAGWQIASEGQFAEVVGITDTALSVPTVVHEVGHMLGVGHAGQFFMAGDMAGEYEVPYIFSAEELATYDISSILAVSDFEAYGDGCNIMGSESYCPQLNGTLDAVDNTMAYPFYINPVQEYLLDWSDEYKSVYVTLLESGKTTELNTGEEHGIATVEIEEPIQFDGYAGGTDSTFNKLSFTANCTPDKYEWAYRCVDMYLHNDSSTAYIGSLISYDNTHNTITTIKVRDKSITVRITNGRITVTSNS